MKAYTRKIMCYGYNIKCDNIFFCLAMVLLNLCNNSDQHDFAIHEHSQGPSGSVENLGLRPRFSTLPSLNLAMVNEWKILFDPSSESSEILLSFCKTRLPRNNSKLVLQCFHIEFLAEN